MLTIAITTFFTLALICAVVVIASMFLGYREKIAAVLLSGVSKDTLHSANVARPYKARQLTPHHLMVQHRSYRLNQPSHPIRAAA